MEEQIVTGNPAIDKTLKIQFAQGLTTQGYTAYETRRRGFYRIKTANYDVVFSRNTMRVNWGQNDNRFCLNEPESIVRRFRELLPA